MNGEVGPSKIYLREITETAVEIARYAFANTIEPFKTKYTCMTSKFKDLSGVAVQKSDEGHLHPCPVEGDMCASWKCNSLGSCCA